jgi:hypothetical protein
MWFSFYAQVLKRMVLSKNLKNVLHVKSIFVIFTCIGVIKSHSPSEPRTRNLSLGVSLWLVTSGVAVKYGGVL